LPKPGTTDAAVEHGASSFAALAANSASLARPWWFNPTCSTKRPRRWYSARFSSEITGHDLFRVGIPANASTGLRADSEVMVDKLSAVSRHRIRKRVGRLSDAQMEMVDRAIRMWLDLLP
jgi:hypothetical protein